MIRYSRFGRGPLAPARLDGRLLEVDADDPPGGDAARPLVHEDALAAAHVEQRLRVGLREQLVQRPLEVRHQAPDDRVGRAVLVVGVAGDDACVVDGDVAHSRTASRSSVVRGRGERARGLGRAWPRRGLLRRGHGARLVVRGRDVELELDAPDALEDALGHDPLAVEQVADDPERREHDGRVEQHRAEDERLHVPAPSPDT
jgi:hypothetical protein